MKKNVLILALVLSLCVHLAFFSAFTFYSKARGNPVIYFWPGIIAQGDIARKKSGVHLPEGVSLSINTLAREYFIPSEFYPKAVAYDKERHPDLSAAGELNNTTECLYLWDKGASDVSATDEQITFKAYVSSSGQVVFLYPQKLSSNSLANLSQEEYARESTAFLNDKFFWTKIDAVVQ